MTLHTLMLVAAVLTHQLHGKVAQSNIDTKDCKDRYKYVVALIQSYHRWCSGTLISPNWVVTAAHCLDSVTHIQYDNLTIPFTKTHSYRKVSLIERPPASKILEPDLGLIYVSSVPMSEYGQLSAVDYKAMAGHSIEYASFGFTKENEGKIQDQVCLLQIREGAVSLCNKDEKSAFAPYLCVATKCSEMKNQTPLGEPGSPLFHAGKLAGVHVGDTLNALRSYTPVSPHLAWIQRVMNKEGLNTRTNIVKTYKPSEFRNRRLRDLSKYLQGLIARVSYKDEKYKKRDAEDPRMS